MGLRPVVSVFFLRILILFLFCATGARGALAAPEVASFKINNGAATTANPAVTLPNICEDAVSGTHFYMASESADFTSATWKPYASVPLFVLSRCAGEKTVYFKIRNSTGLESAVTSDTITLSASGHVVVPFGNNSVHQSDAPSPATEFVSVSAGTGYSLGLKSTGSIVAWGSNTYNKCVVPEPNSGFAAIAAGHYHSLGLKSDGSILAWGLNDYNQCTVPQPNREFVAISAGYLHNIGLKADGSVVTWGLNNYGQCGYFEPNTGFVAVAAGYAHNLALRADGSIRAWGGNEWGQCTVPEPNRDFIAIAAGWEHSLGLKSDGSIVAWGYNYSGQCDVPSPNTGFVAVAAGYSHSLGLKADGSIVAWGRNDSGECNVPAPNQDFAAIAGGLNHSLALTIEGSVKVTLTPAEAVAAGARWRLSTLEKGTWHDESEYDPTWVWNQSDDIVTTQTGTYNLKFKTVYGWEKPANRSVDITTTGTAQVTAAYTRTLWTLETSCTHGSIQVSPAGTSFPHETTVTLSVQPAPGYWFDRWVGDVPKGFERATSFTLEMNADKKIWADIEPLPAPPTDLTVAINNGLPTTVNPAVTLANRCTGSTSGTLVSYMASESADFTSATWQPYRSVPLFILSREPGVKTIYFKAKDYAGIESNVTSDTITLHAPKSVVGWGNSSFPEPNRDFVAVTQRMGLKSDGSIVQWGNYYKLPEPNRDFVAISEGYNSYCLGLRADGSIAMWGTIYKVPEPNRDFVAISASDRSCLGLKSDGSIVNLLPYSKPIPEPNCDFVGIAAGGYYRNYGLKSDGSLVSLGYDKLLPESNRDFVAVVASSRNDLTLGLKSDGSIVAWGYYSSPEVPSPNRDFVAIAVRDSMGQGLKADGSIVTWGAYSSYYYDPSPVPNQGFVALSGDGSALALGEAGRLRVTLTPPEAVAAGAKWRLAGEKTGYSWKESGTTVTRAVGTAQLELNDDFPGWYAQSNGETIAIQKDTLTSITAVYVRGQTWPLFVKAENGSVAKSPSKTHFRDGSTVTLTASPNSGCHFTEWTGDLTTTTQNPIVLTMDSTKTISAHFAINVYRLTVEATGTTGTVSVSPEQTTYTHGSLITLTATPAPGYRFVRWEGDVAESDAGKNPLQLNLGRDSVFRAVFERIPAVPMWLISRADGGVFPGGIPRIGASVW